MATTRRDDHPVIEPPEPLAVEVVDNTPTAPPATGSPRPTFDGPAAIPSGSAVRYLWGDDVSGEVSDWIYASTDLIHMLVWALPPGGKCLHSDSHRTVFGADVTYFVLGGTLVLANPESGEVRVAEAGEAVLFRRDTWHHIFSHGLDLLRVLEFFAPPPSTGTSRKYAQTLPLLKEVRHANDELLGRWPLVQPEPTLHLRTASDTLWRRDGDALVGITVSTEHLTVGTLSLLPGCHSDTREHEGDETLYVIDGVLNVRTWSEGSEGWHELHQGDGFYCPAGTPHRYSNVSGGIAKAVFGVAPRW
jgi:quercetin dioxygenase-like cupin family protein